MSIIIILTLNAEEYIENILNVIDLNKYHILVIDSSSSDNTIKICKRFSCEMEIISRSEFNHGSTREMARKIVGTDISVCLTQDVIPLDSTLIEKLIAPILNKKVVVSYARQIPHAAAGSLEAFPRQYIYPNISNIRNIHDVDTYGVQLFQCSDSCAAWLSSALD